MFCLSVNFLCSSTAFLADRCTDIMKWEARSLGNKNPTIVPVIELLKRNSSGHNETTNSMNARINLAGELDILDLAEKQETWLKDMYKNYKFHSVPLRGHQWRITNGAKEMITWLELYSPYRCIFKTQKARSLSSVVCQDLQCKLAHTVSTEDTYQTEIGFRLSVSPRVQYGISLQGGVQSTLVALGTLSFEMGFEFTGELSGRCSYTKGLTTTENVECEVGTGKTGNLQLYIIKSDMECDIGRVIMEKDKRSGKEEISSVLLNIQDITEIKENAAIKLTCALRDFGGKDCDGLDTYMIDVVRMSKRMVEKLSNIFPKMDPYTDTISILNEKPSEILVKVMYYRVDRKVLYRTITVPFSNENGDAVYQYACILTPLY